MAAYKVLAVTLLASLVSCEPPIQGLSAPYSYQAPSASYGAPSQSYNAPRSSYNAPSSSYNSPSSGYGAPSSGYDGSYDDGHGHGHGNGHDNEVPKSYEFGYSVKDAHSGNDYDRKETSDGNTVRGEYRVQLPDGRLQIVTYHADWQTGFHADVRYEGEAKYPEPSYNRGYAASGQDGYNYNSPSSHGGDFSGSLTGFHGNGNQDYSGNGNQDYSGNGNQAYSKPSTGYGTPQFH